MISDKDNIFSYQSSENYIPAERKAYYGGGSFHSSIFSELYNYICGYRHALDILYQSFKYEANQGNIEFQDTIIYPLIFCHRHTLELELKYSAITFCDTDFKENIKQVFAPGHDLLKIWNFIKPQIRAKAERIGYNIEFDAITHYISEIQSIDADSFNYRYPVDRHTLEPTIKKMIELDVPNMHEKLLELHDYLMHIAQDIEYQCDDLPYNKDFKSQLRYFVKLNFNKILDILHYNLHNVPAKSEKVWLSPSEIPYISPDEDKDSIFSYNVPIDIKKVLLYLYLAKENIRTNRLANDNQEYIKDIYRIIYTHSTNPMFSDKRHICNYFHDKFPLIIKESDWYIKFLEMIKTNNFVS